MDRTLPAPTGGDVLLIGGPFDGMTVNAPTGYSITVWDPTRGPGETSEFRYIIRKLNPLTAYIEGSSPDLQQ